MPLVRIDLCKGKPVEYVRAVGEAIHRAIVEVLGAPARDKPEDWSFGNGVGQYMVLPREKWK